jgi:hypothetical protein
LLLPLLRAGIGPPELPDLGTDPQFELPRVSGREGDGREKELFCGLTGRDPAILLCPAFCPDWPKRWNPLFEPLFKLVFKRVFEPLFKPVFDLAFNPVFELPLPGRAIPRPLPFETCGRPSSTERGAGLLVRAEKKC